MPSAGRGQLALELAGNTRTKGDHNAKWEVQNYCQGEWDGMDRYGGVQMAPVNAGRVALLGALQAKAERFRGKFQRHVSQRVL